MSVYKYNGVNVKKINYKKPEKNGSFYYASINYDNTPFHIQSPKMKCKSTGEEIISKGYLECETINTDFSFYDFILNIEDRNIKETFKQNEDWFGKEIPLEIIDDMYKRTIRPVKKDSKPSFNFKVPVLKGKIQCQVYDTNNVCVDISKLTPDCELVFILHIRGLKFLKQHYYCDCYISQIKVFLSKDQKYNLFNECMIEEELDNGDDEIDIIDDEILKEMKIEKNKVKKKEELRLNIENKIIELKQELENL